MFERAGYGEVYTPALEYEQHVRPRRHRRRRPAYRMFDEHGNVLVLRSDMTVPIARLVGDPLRRTPSRRCASATSPTPTAACARSAGSRASSCRPGSS